MLMHTLERFRRWDARCECILVLPAGQAGCWRRLCEEFHCSIPHRMAEGGETRFHSVRNGLALLEEDRPAEGYTAVHDGVRPFVDTSVIEACFVAAERYGAAIPVVPALDSLGQVSECGEYFPANRSRFFAVQTPQVFRTEWLLHAYRQDYRPDFTDDASVVKADGQRIHTVPGNRENIKITGPFDLLIAEALLNQPDALC